MRFRMIDVLRGWPALQSCETNPNWYLLENMSRSGWTVETLLFGLVFGVYERSPFKGWQDHGRTRSNTAEHGRTRPSPAEPANNTNFVNNRVYVNFDTGFGLRTPENPKKPSSYWFLTLKSQKLVSRRCDLNFWEVRYWWLCWDKVRNAYEEGFLGFSGVLSPNPVSKLTWTLLLTKLVLLAGSAGLGRVRPCSTVFDRVRPWSCQPLKWNLSKQANWVQLSNELSKNWVKCKQKVE